MVQVNVERLAAELAAKSPPRGAVVRQGAEVVADDAGSSGAKVSRFAIEVCAKVPSRAGVVRQGAEVVADDAGSSGVKVERFAIEAAAKTPVRAGVVRQGAEVVADDAGAGGGARISRFAIEVAMRASVPAPTPGLEVTPISSSLDFFMHNWATEVKLETSYATDIIRSPHTNSEERISRLQRPGRAMSIRWLGKSREFVDRLIVTLRRMTRERLSVPLFPDVSVLTGGSVSAESVLRLTTSYRRFFIGGRVVVFPIGGEFDDTLHLNDQVHVFTVTGNVAGQLTVSGTLGADFSANRWVACPLIDLEKMTDPRWTALTDDTANVTLTVNEFPGKSALPPVITGHPDGWQSYDGLPIFEPVHNWAEGLPTNYKVRSRRVRSGRRFVIEQEGERYLQVTGYRMLMHRSEWWPILNFFDSRRGRGRIFWEIDREYQWTVADTDPFFIDVTPQGQFSDFEDDWEWAGIVMNDGTIYIRPVAIVSDTGGVWRLTLTGTALPAIDVSQIARFARCRKKRFSSDAMEEVWKTNNAVEVELETIEVDDEGDIEIGS